MIRARVITCSDTASRGEREDRSGPAVREILIEHGFDVELVVVPDDVAAIAAAIANANARLVVTTGGTGIAPRDVTYPTLKRMFDSEIPGFGELFRQLSFREIGSATLLSRAVGGLVSGKVVLALPGSPKALRLALDEIVIPEADHLVSQARGPGAP